jgi:hypothetical protein
MTFDALIRTLESFESKSFGRGALDAEIDAASLRLGLGLRGGYRNFLRHFGWGGVGSLELFGLGADVPAWLDLVAVTESERSEMHPALPRTLVPLLNDGGGNLYCLDVGVPGEPPVVYWEHTGGERHVPEPVAPDFVSWLADRLTRER